MGPEFAGHGHGHGHEADELLDALRMAAGGSKPVPNRTPAQEMSLHRMPEAEVIVDQMSSVSSQPGYTELYTTVGAQLAERLVNGADMAGTLLAAVVRFVKDEEPIIKGIAHTLVQDWIIALAEGDREFEADAGRFFAHVLMGTVAVMHLDGKHDH